MTPEERARIDRLQPLAFGLLIAVYAGALVLAGAAIGGVFWVLAQVGGP